MCVSTHEYHLMLGKNVISQLEITEQFCYYPPPLNGVGSWRSRKNSATTPPPPLNRVGLWRSRKRLKKLNNLNLAALPSLLCTGKSRRFTTQKCRSLLQHLRYLPSGRFRGGGPGPPFGKVKKGPINGKSCL